MLKYDGEVVTVEPVRPACGRALKERGDAEPGAIVARCRDPKRPSFRSEVEKIGKRDFADICEKLWDYDLDLKRQVNDILGRFMVVTT